MTKTRWWRAKNRSLIKKIYEEIHVLISLKRQDENVSAPASDRDTMLVRKGKLKDRTATSLFDCFTLVEKPVLSTVETGTLSFSPPSHLSNALTGKCIAENPGVGLQGSADWVQHVFNYIHIILLIAMFCCGHPLSSMWSKLPNPIVHSKINRFFPLMVHPVCQTGTNASRSLTYVSCKLMWCAQTAFSGGIAPNSKTASCVHCTIIIFVHRSASAPTLHQWESLSQIFNSGKESWFCTRKNLKEV